MANVTTADVKKLREMTGAGMMDCKRALEEADGDLQKAVELLRVKGLKGVTKREGRTASNGLVTAATADGVGTLLEVNCETDFVAKGETFQALAQQVLDTAVAHRVTDTATLQDTALAPEQDGKDVKALLDEVGVTIGEKVEVRRVSRVEGAGVVSYLHRTSPDLPPQIGVLVATDADAPELARDVAMHVAALSPVYLRREDVPADVVENERRIAEETAREEGKPEQALARIVDGRVNGFFKDNVLLEQPFAKDPKRTVTQVLAGAGVAVSAFARFRVGS